MGHRHIWLWFLAMVPDIYSRAYFRAALGQPAGLQGWLGRWACMACIGLYTRPHCIFKSINNVDRSLSCITELFRSITDLFFEVVSLLKHYNTLLKRFMINMFLRYWVVSILVSNKLVANSE